jgi:hypothetical protein
MWKLFLGIAATKERGVYDQLVLQALGKPRMKRRVRATGYHSSGLSGRGSKSARQGVTLEGCGAAVGCRSCKVCLSGSGGHRVHDVPAPPSAVGPCPSANPLPSILAQKKSTSLEKSPPMEQPAGAPAADAQPPAAPHPGGPVHEGEPASTGGGLPPLVAAIVHVRAEASANLPPGPNGTADAAAVPSGPSAPAAGTDAAEAELLNNGLEPGSKPPEAAADFGNEVAGAAGGGGSPAKAAEGRLPFQSPVPSPGPAAAPE